MKDSKENVMTTETVRPAHLAPGDILTNVEALLPMVREDAATCEPRAT